MNRVGLLNLRSLPPGTIYALVRNPSYGFAFEGRPEFTMTTFDTVMFYSSEYSDIARRPELRISYIDNDTSVSTSIRNISELVEQWTIFPNPSNGTSFVRLELMEPVSVSCTVFNIEGKLCTSFVQKDAHSGIIPIILTDKGIYKVQLEIDGKRYYKKLVVL